MDGNNNDIARRRATYVGEVEDCLKTMRVAREIADAKRSQTELLRDKRTRHAPELTKILSAADLVRLDAFKRLKAQRSALLLNTSEFYRDNPKADVALGITILTTMLSDNDQGINSLSEGNMAQILWRTREAVSRASAKEAAAGRVIKVGETGKSSQLAPVIPACFAKEHHPTWVLSALKGCDDERTGRIGTCDDLRTPTCDDERTGLGGTCDDVAGEPVTTSSHKFYLLNSEENGADAPRPNEGVIVNCADISYGGGSIPYSEIDAAADKAKIDRDRLRKFAEEFVRELHQSGKPLPDNAVKEITTAAKKAIRDEGGTFLPRKFEGSTVPDEFWVIAREKGFPDDITKMELRVFHNFHTDPDKPVNVRRSKNWPHKWTGWLDKPQAQNRLRAHRTQIGRSAWRVEDDGMVRG